jgi:hypothetical protein
VEALLRVSATSFDGWSPVRVFCEPDDGWSVEWCRMGEERFSDPFFAQTIDRALRRPFNQAFRRRTRLDTLGEALGGANALRPAGLIFHMSRCGSTLVAQMLAALPGSIVISEAEPVDDVLAAHRHDPAVTDEWRVERLRWIVTALGRSVRGDPGRFVLKMDSWHVLDLPLIRRAFPGVPSIMVYRDPVEVLVSHQREPGWTMVPIHAERLLGVTPAEAMNLSQEDYRARVLERFLGAMVRDDDPACRLVNYVELPGAATESIPRWFGIELGRHDREMMAEAARRDAKQPFQQHTPDSAEKQRGAGAAIRTAAAVRPLPVYQALEARRQRQRPVPSAATPQKSEMTIP